MIFASKRKIKTWIKRARGAPDRESIAVRAKRAESSESAERDAPNAPRGAERGHERSDVERGEP